MLFCIQNSSRAFRAHFESFSGSFYSFRLDEFSMALVIFEKRNRCKGNIAFNEISSIQSSILGVEFVLNRKCVNGMCVSFSFNFQLIFAACGGNIENIRFVSTSLFNQKYSTSMWPLRQINDIEKLLTVCNIRNHIEMSTIHHTTIARNGIELIEHSKD